MASSTNRMLFLCIGVIVTTSIPTGDSTNIMSNEDSLVMRSGVDGSKFSPVVVGEIQTLRYFFSNVYQKSFAMFRSIKSYRSEFIERIRETAYNDGDDNKQREIDINSEKPRREREMDREFDNPGSLEDNLTDVERSSYDEQPDDKTGSNDADDADNDHSDIEEHPIIDSRSTRPYSHYDAPLGELSALRFNKLTKLHKTGPFQRLQGIDIEPHSIDQEKVLDDVTSSDDEKSRKKRETGHGVLSSDSLTVELLLVVDVSLFWWWNNLTVDLQVQDQKTDDVILEYYGYVYKGIDERLQSMSSQGININLAFSGLYVAESEAESHWTTTSVIEDEAGSERPMVNASEALDKFQMWLDNMTDLPHYDHAILFTGTNLTYAGSTGNTGLAFASSMCLNISNSSIVEDQLDIRTVTFATQQIARSLGSNDDMDNNDCLEFFNYIMAPKLKLPFRSFAANRWKFSACSQQYIKDYVSGLNEAGLNCLANTTTQSRYPENISFVTENLFGKVTDAKRQCQLRFGLNSDVCRMRIGTGYNKICSGLPCSLSGGDLCEYILPADGTPCGDQKYCWQGQCKMFPDASPTSDTCVFGNDPNIDCGPLVVNNASLCYKETIRYSCCASCERVALDVVGCEYGNRISDCGLKACVNGDETYVRTSCCLTCSNGPTPYAPSTEPAEPNTITPAQPSSQPPTSLYTNTLSSATTGHTNGLKLQSESVKHMLTTTTLTTNTVTTTGETQSPTIYRTSVSATGNAMNFTDSRTETPARNSDKLISMSRPRYTDCTFYKTPATPPTNTTTCNCKHFPTSIVTLTERGGSMDDTSLHTTCSPHTVERSLLGQVARMMRQQQQHIQDKVHRDMNALFQDVSSRLGGYKTEYENESEVYRRTSELRSGEEEDLNHVMFPIWRKYYRQLMTNLTKNVKEMRYKVLTVLTRGKS